MKPNEIKALKIRADFEKKIPKLKKCPFCGQKAVLETEEDHHGKCHSLGCSREKCIAFHVGYTFPDDELQYWVERWNGRAVE